MKSEDLLPALALNLIPGIGSVTGRKLIDYFGSADRVLKASADEIVQIEHISVSGAKHLFNSFRESKFIDQAGLEGLFIEKYNIIPYVYGTENYPSRLKNTTDGPIILFSKGNAELNKKKVLCVVGTRSATDNGKKLCSDLMEAFAGLDILIVSGLAYGIDIAAHREALKNGLSTVAVLAHGLKSLYPASHRATAQKMIDNGALVTEFFSDDKAMKENFPRRNRIIAGLSDACLVVEAGKGGGALITAGIAASYDRTVLAFPGRTSDPWSKGCLDIIYNQEAQLVRSPEDVLFQMGWDNESSEKPLKENNKDSLQHSLSLETDLEKAVNLFIINKIKPSMDEILNDFSEPPGQIQVALLHLQISGKVRQLPGNRFENC